MPLVVCAPALTWCKLASTDQYIAHRMVEQLPHQCLSAHKPQHCGKISLLNTKWPKQTQHL